MEAREMSAERLRVLVKEKIGDSGVELLRAVTLGYDLCCRFLLALDDSKMDVAKGKRADNFYAISWVSTFGKGRTFYCSLGHQKDIYWNPMILKHYLAGIQYALGDLEADAAPTSKTSAGK